MGTDTETRFASLHRRDSESNLDLTHFRMFSSDQGRWFSPDPAKGCGSDPQKLNRYAYVANAPTNRIDPRGDQFFCIFGCFDDFQFCITDALFANNPPFDVGLFPCIRNCSGLTGSTYLLCFNNCVVIFANKVQLCVDQLELCIYFNCF